jgi:CHAT domain-containing protein/prefoldin subunit 5
MFKKLLVITLLMFSFVDAIISQDNVDNPLYESLSITKEENYEQVIKEYSIYNNLILVSKFADEGDTSFNKNEFNNAVVKYKIALKCALTLLEVNKANISINTQIMSIRARLGKTYINLNEFIKAIDELEICKNAYKDIADPKLLIEIFKNLSRAYRELADYSKAKSYAEDCLRVAKTLNDHTTLVSALNAISAVYLSENNLEMAYEYLTSGIRIAEAHNLENERTDLLYKIGLVHRYKGDNIQAIKFYEEALHLAKKLQKKRLQGTILGNIGLMYDDQGSYEKASFYYQESLSLARQMKDRRNEAWNLILMGILKRDHSKIQKNNQLLDESFSHLNEGLNIATEIQSKVLEISAIMNIGTAYIIKGDYNKAEEYLQKSLLLAKSINNLDRIAIAQKNIALLYHNKKDYIRSIQYADESIRTLETISATYYISLIIKGEGLYTLKDYVTARQCFERAVQVIEKLRMKIVGDEVDKQAFFSTKLAPYRYLVDILVRQNKFKEALYYADRAKARALLDLMTIDSSNKKTISEPFTIEDINKIRPPTNEAYVEYTVLDNKTYLFILKTSTNNELLLDVFTINITHARLKEMVNRYRKLMEDRDPDYEELATELYRLLLKPAEKHLKNIKTICIIPDGPLFDLPFKLLQTSPGRFLIEDCATYQNYSISVMNLLNQKDGRNITSMNFIGFGNPKIESSIVAHISNIYKERGYPLSTIQSSELESNEQESTQKEINSIAEIIGKDKSSVFIGEEATKRAALSYINKYNIIHFATHGLLDDSNPMQSCLVLANFNGSFDQGLLMASDILSLDLSLNDLTVLSSCQSARGQVREGEGLVGLSYAFLKAGSKSVIASQWNVRSERTADLMIKLYQNLYQDKSLKLTKAEALRKASLDILYHTNYTHPKYWGGFILIGNQ